MRRIALLAFLAIPACGLINAELYDTRPSQWTEQELAIARSADNAFTDLCRIYDLGAQGSGLGEADFKVLNRTLRHYGLTKRDLEILRDPKADIGTGQTFLGLQCQNINDVEIVNRAYYPGTGHQWQVKVGGSYVYLEGNNTNAGMTVYAWN
ncbi:hypothetical protein [uncultured Pseudophaeobacter sp.]|jgi:hypothetical protein|uniref:hypothetical protein n=1 Tax=uncultured Pseudophaeobacter sp. TaxID=1759421 RepID=UPI0025DB03CC|nr:hypothetical protein [uncultured Pseudophaeobacter sp.]